MIVNWNGKIWILILFSFFFINFPFSSFFFFFYNLFLLSPFLLSCFLTKVQDFSYVFTFSFIPYQHPIRIISIWNETDRGKSQRRRIELTESNFRDEVTRNDPDIKIRRQIETFKWTDKKETVCRSHVSPLWLLHGIHVAWVFSKDSSMEMSCAPRPP